MSDNAVVDLEWLCNWLEDNSSGAYRPCKEAAHVIRTMYKEIQELKNSKDSGISLFEKEYDGESIIDIEQDLFDKFNEDLGIPQDECGFDEGIFKVVVTWREE